MIVQKYGGSTLSTPKKILAIAEKVAELHKQGEKIILVVSAMGRTTDELVELAYQIAPRPNRRELDMLLTTGERISMSLMSMALSHLGRLSISFTGSQAGIFTTSSHSDAKITGISPIRVEQELQQNKIVVLAGYQGVNPTTKEVTTLGRGGSDTSAVAMAAHFKAKRCEILKDVPGVFSADPFVVEQAQVYKQVPFEILTEMCWWGAKVLHSRSVDLAWKSGVPLFVGLASDRDKGTLIVEGENKMFEQPEVWGIHCLAPVEQIYITSPTSSEAVSLLADFCSERSLPTPKILTSDYENNEMKALISADAESLKSLVSNFTDHPQLRASDTKLAVITLAGYGMSQPELLKTALAQLNNLKMRVHRVLGAPRSLSLVVDFEHREKAVQALHTLKSTKI